MTQTESRSSTQKRGRPKLDIDPDAVADAVAELFAEGGVDAVSMVDAAEKLQVSRATLYRTVPTKEHLLGVLFERSTRELTERAQAVVDTHEHAWEQLHGLVRILVDAAIRMRRYMPVFFGGGDLPGEVFFWWHKWSRDFESLWVGVVAAAMREGYLTDADPLVTARLLLGECIWVSRWYRPAESYDVEIITDAVLKLLPPVPGNLPPKRRAARSRKASATKPNTDR
ncbi:TetR/AcrR family transcriptional regulator (plasmid) [Rhodococcus sp. ZPP]|uniref:TetR/AcrR family transcriptional regulator n=1 Tax=Rhodococcus sp. ZPP TaxID=2749906 RepID=UPI001AD854F7|nr:TetR/AcrR family transcriptional regulator [Rhodococcus sp. ZPP]QTJ70720.1 TetR/AcrR family transcriptional regulator [Rhodococcus sp. ZPP]